MKLNYNLIRLTEHILNLSKADTFNEALPEWEVIGVTLAEAKCPCGVSILQNCHLHNKVTLEDTIVGSTCVKRFLGITTIAGVNLEKLFAGLARLAHDNTSCPSKEVVAFADVQGFLYPSETKFLLDIVNKRKLSDKQESWRKIIVYRILNKVEVPVED
jgi:hypothetical protein